MKSLLFSILLLGATISSSACYIGRPISSDFDLKDKKITPDLNQRAFMELRNVDAADVSEMQKEIKKLAKFAYRNPNISFSINVLMPMMNMEVSSTEVNGEMEVTYVKDTSVASNKGEQIKNALVKEYGINANRMEVRAVMNNGWGEFALKKKDEKYLHTRIEVVVMSLDYYPEPSPVIQNIVLFEDTVDDVPALQALHQRPTQIVAPMESEEIVDVSNEFEEKQGADLVATVYPNPTSNNVNISLKSNAGLDPKVRLYDSKGQYLQEILIGGINNVTLDLSEYPLGLYLISVENASGDRELMKVMRM